jgi:hypothetical protein
MEEFADELRADIDEAARKMADAQADGDSYGADAYSERLKYLRRFALRHAVGSLPCAALSTARLSGACG